MNNLELIEFINNVIYESQAMDLNEDEYINDRLVRLNDGQVNYIRQAWNTLSDFDRKSGKYIKLYNKALNDKILDVMDWQDLKHYLKYGHSKVYYK